MALFVPLCQSGSRCLFVFLPASFRLLLCVLQRFSTNKNATALTQKSTMNWACLQLLGVPLLYFLRKVTQVHVIRIQNHTFWTTLVDCSSPNHREPNSLDDIRRLFITHSQGAAGVRAADSYTSLSWVTLQLTNQRPYSHHSERW